MFFKKKIPPYPFKEYPIMQQPSLVPTFGQQAQIDRKFGMFLHFGINTFNNTEWSDGKLPIESYQPTAIDAENWVKTAYEAVTRRFRIGCGMSGSSSCRTQYSAVPRPLRTVRCGLFVRLDISVKSCPG